MHFNGIYLKIVLFRFFELRQQSYFKNGLWFSVENFRKCFLLNVACNPPKFLLETLPGFLFFNANHQISSKISQKFIGDQVLWSTDQ